MAQYQAYLVPTLVIYDALFSLGQTNGLSEETMKKVYTVRENGLNAIKLARSAGVKVGFGTDLLGVDGHLLENLEFKIRSKIETPQQTLESATKINAEILKQSGKLGVIKEGAYADLLVINGNPLEDILLLTNPEENLMLIMKDGVIYKNQL